MNALVPIALFGWPFVVVGLFAWLPKHRAVIVAFLVGWLFLPVVNDPVLGVRWTKMRATCDSVLVAALLLDVKSVLSFRGRLVDLPMAGWCLSPVFSSWENNLGIYDAASQSLDQFVSWGLPYLMGRIYLTNLDRLREMALGVIWSGLVYLPLCLLEIRLSPQLHTWVYGYFPHASFAQSMRYGGYRPTVFLEHGLAVGAWLCTATMTAYWIWYSGAARTLQLGARRLRLGLATGMLFVVSILSKSFGAVGLELVGAATLSLCAWSRWRAATVILMIVPVFYVYSRVWGGWTGMGVVDAVGGLVDRERAASFAFRLENENLLIKKAMQRAIFGWGGWGRSRVYDEEGNDLTTTDGLWIIVFGDRGLLGLSCLGLAIGLPAALVFWRLPASSWSRPEFGAPVVLAMALVLYLVDGLANAMINPVFMLFAGGLNSFVAVPVRQWGHLSAANGSSADRPRAPVTSRYRPGRRLRAVAKYGPEPPADGNQAAPCQSGEDETCPAP